MTRHRRFAQVDVFGTKPYLGNPVAVVVDGNGLSDEEMLRVARWTNLSETTFVLPPTNKAADYRLRIFTPTGELPFAGHPTLGSAHAWLQHGGVPKDRQTIVQETESTLIDVRLSEAGTMSFAAPPTSRTGRLNDAYLNRIIAGLSIERRQVHSHQWVDNGPGWAVVRLHTAQDVLDLTPRLSLIADAMVGAIGAYPDSSEYAFEMRTFAPRVGLTEDPVCGSMNASVAQWLLRTGEVTDSYRVSQGTKLGRAGDVTVTPDDSGKVWVGGATTTLIDGMIVI